MITHDVHALHASFEVGGYIQLVMCSLPEPGHGRSSFCHALLKMVVPSTWVRHIASEAEFSDMAEAGYAAPASQVTNTAVCLLTDHVPQNLCTSLCMICSSLQSCCTC